MCFLRASAKEFTPCIPFTPFTRAPHEVAKVLINKDSDSVAIEKKSHVNQHTSSLDEVALASLPLGLLEPFRNVPFPAI